MKILFIGAHPDDIEIYCGGTILKLVECGIKPIILTVTRAKTKKKMRVEESMMAWKVLGVDGFKGETKFKSGELEHKLSLVSYIDQVINKFKPNVIFSHCLEDYHQDHRAIAMSVRSALRGKDITWLTFPFHEKFINFPYNFVVEINDYLDDKNDMLDCFKSQKDKWYLKKARTSMVERFKVERIVWTEQPLVKK